MADLTLLAPGDRPTARLRRPPGAAAPALDDLVPGELAPDELAPDDGWRPAAPADPLGRRADVPCDDAGDDVDPDRPGSMPGPMPRAAARASTARPAVGVLGAERLLERLREGGRLLGVQVRTPPATTGERPVRPRGARPPADPCADPLPLADFAARCDVVTAVAEHVPATTLGAVAQLTSVRPGATLLAVAQDRAAEKRWLDDRAGHAAPWQLARTPEELAAAVRTLCEGEGGGFAGGCMLKPALRRVGGPSPCHVATPEQARGAWAALGGRPVVVEQALAVELELTVLVARTPRGAQAVYPVALTQRAGTRRLWSVLPAPVPPPVARKAQRIASFYATRLAVEGLLAVELFVLADGRMVVNELVPCPHPAFDASGAACATEQCEQLLRAVLDLPLGPTVAVTPAASLPIPAAHRPPGGPLLGVEALPLLPGVDVTWYPADAVAPGQHPGDDAVGGHLVATGETPEDAVARALHAAALLRRVASCPALARADDPGIPGYPWRRRFAAS